MADYKLLPLPEHASRHAIVEFGNPVMVSRDLYTAAQMERYAIDNIAATAESAMAWNGFMVRGDKASVAEVRQLVCATPPAGAGEAVAFLPALPPGIVAEMREWLRHAEADDGAQTLANAAFTVRDWADRINVAAQAALAGVAAPTPLPEAVRELPWHDSDFQHGLRLILDAVNRGARVQPHNTTEIFIIKRTVEVLDRALTGGDKQGEKA